MTQTISKTLRRLILALGVAAISTDAASAQSNGGTNTGSVATNSANRGDDAAPASSGVNWGWVGLFGLAGLAGLWGGKDRDRDRGVTGQ